MLPLNVGYKKILTKFYNWRYKQISSLQFTYMLSIVVGLLAGLGSVIIKNLTHFIQSLLEGKIIKEYHHAFYFIFPIIGLFIVYLLKTYVIKKQINHGIPSTLYAIAKKNGIMERYKLYASLITAPITAGFGGSVGLQGPAVSTAAALGSNLAQFFQIDSKKRMLLIGCATAGAMSSMFKAPITAIIFAVEIFNLELAVVYLVPLLFASVSAVITSYFFRGKNLLFNFEVVDVFQIRDIAFYILLGIGTGIASIYFSKIYFFITRFFKRMDHYVKRLLLGGVIIGILLYCIPPLFGEGYGLINNLLHGHDLQAIGYVPFLSSLKENIWGIIVLLVGITFFKAIAMSVTFSAGGVGGIFIPTLVIGSTLGNALAKVINHIGLGFHVSESNFTLIGMTGMMAGVLHAPLTAIFLIAEITGGYELFVPLMIVSTISFALTRHFISNSIYTEELAKRGELLTHDKDKNALLLMDLDTVIERDFIAIKPKMKLGKMLKHAVAKSNRNLFPVVNKHQEFLGIVLLDDIRNIMFNKKMYKRVHVRDLMHNAPALIFYESDSMEVIMEKFTNTRAWNLPVIKDGVYYGFISKSKLLTAYRTKLIEVTS